MNTIWKFPLEVTDRQFVSMPLYAKILSVQAQKETPCLWALVNSQFPTENRIIVMKGTGHPVPDVGSLGDHYIDSFQLFGGDLVFHVFEDQSDLQDRREAAMRERAE